MAHSGHHEQFLETGTVAASGRRMVADSWIRSAAAGVDPDANLTPVVREHADLVEYRAAHPLAQVFPVLWDVLGRAAEDSGCWLAVGGGDGTLLLGCRP